MASITEISVEHIHNAYESIRGNIAVEAFYAVVTGFMAVTLIHRLYTVYREVQSNEDGTPTMKDYMNLVWQYVFCIAAVALFPVLLEALETVFGKLMDDLQAGFGGKVYDVADLFQNAGKLFGVAGIHLAAKGHDVGGQGMSCKLLLLLYILSAFGNKIILTLRFRYRGLLGQIDAVKVNVFVHHKGSCVSFPFFILW